MRLLGFALIAVAIVAAILHSAFGLHTYANDAVNVIYGAYATQTLDSPVGEGVVYLVIYFVGLLGLVLLAVKQPA
jgi:hypothetical protein